MTDADPYSQTADAAAHHHTHEEHAVPLKYLAGVFAALLVLTAVTVAIRYVDLGELNLFAALVIAVIKGGLVVAVFMHLWWDSRFNFVCLVSALAFVALFIALAILDSHEYRDNIESYRLVNPITVPEPAADADAAPAAEAH